MTTTPTASLTLLQLYCAPSAMPDILNFEIQNFKTLSNFLRVSSHHVSQHLTWHRAKINSSTSKPNTASAESKVRKMCHQNDIMHRFIKRSDSVTIKDSLFRNKYKIPTFFMRMLRLSDAFLTNGDFLERVELSLSLRFICKDKRRKVK